MILRRMSAHSHHTGGILMDRRLKRTVLVFLATLTLVACTSAPLKPAAPISVPVGVSQAQVKTSIINALEGRGWTLDNLADGDILSTLHLREHTATIRITYDAAAVNLTYLRSTNLNYREKGDQRSIHRNYNGWIDYLEQDIRRNLQNTHALEKQ
jgi:hypothetical protein